MLWATPLSLKPPCLCVLQPLANGPPPSPPRPSTQTLVHPRLPVWVLSVAQSPCSSFPRCTHTAPRLPWSIMHFPRQAHYHITVRCSTTRSSVSRGRLSSPRTASASPFAPYQGHRPRSSNASQTQIPGLHHAQPLRSPLLQGRASRPLQRRSALHPPPRLQPRSSYPPPHPLSPLISPNAQHPHSLALQYAPHSSPLGPKARQRPNQISTRQPSRCACSQVPRVSGSFIWVRDSRYPSWRQRRILCV